MARLSQDELIDLAARAKAGDTEARNRIVEANLPLAISVAESLMRSRRKGWRTNAVARADILQEATTGLIRAASDFDPSEGRAFSTYAVPWIRRQVNEAMRTSQPVSVPDRAFWDAVHLRSKCQSNIDSLRLGLESMPGWSRDRLECALAAMDVVGAKVCVEYSPPADIESPRVTAERREDLERVRAGMARLSLEDRNALEWRYGIGCEPHGDREMAARMGCTERTVHYRLGRARSRLALAMAS